MLFGNFKKPNRTSAHGFTLLELLLAMTLFVSLLPVLLQAFISSSKQSQSLETDIAYQLARSGLENLNEAVRIDWWEGAGAAGKPLTIENHAATITPLNNVNYSASYVVDQPGNGASKDYRKVTMTVDW